MSLLQGIVFGGNKFSQTDNCRQELVLINSSIAIGVYLFEDALHNLVWDLIPRNAIDKTDKLGSLKLATVIFVKLFEQICKF